MKQILGNKLSKYINPTQKKAEKDKGLKITSNIFNCSKPA